MRIITIMHVLFSKVKKNSLNSDEILAKEKGPEGPLLVVKLHA